MSEFLDIENACDGCRVGQCIKCGSKDGSVQYRGLFDLALCANCNHEMEERLQK